MPERLTGILGSLRAALPDDLDATALAEALWLAAARPQAPAGAQESTEKLSQDFPSGRGGAHSLQERENPASFGTNRIRMPLHEQLPDSNGNLAGNSVSITRGRALPKALELSRALRAYKRQWTAGLQSELDIEQTIDGYARSGELIPAFRAAPERWFDLLLIVDRSLSMQVWKETISELERVLDHLGAFRLLRTWGLTFEDSGPVLHDHRGAVAGPGHVLSPQGRRLVLVLSDCAAPGWYRGEVWQQLRTWAQSTPVALLDPLPPKMWRRTALDFPGVTATQAVPGNGSTTLRFDMPLLLEASDHNSQWLPVSVLSLSPHSLGRWARTQMRGDPVGCDAVLVPSAGRIERGFASRAHGASASPIQLFVRTASPEAVKLAVLCAPVGRIGLPLLHLIRQQLVPKATVADIAELITSDIVSLTSQDDGNFVVTLSEGAQEELKQLLPQHEAWQVYGVLDNYVSEHAHGSLTFPAVAHDPNALNLLPSELRPFGQAALDFLQTLEVIGADAELDSMTTFVASATRRIAGGLDIEEITRGLHASTIPAFADGFLLYLRDPLPVGDERPTGSLVLRLWHGDRIPEEWDAGLAPPTPQTAPDFGVAAELCEVRPSGALAEVLRGVRPAFADAPEVSGALAELIGGDLNVPGGQRAILAPLRGRRRVIGAALFLRRPERIPFETDDLLVAAQLATHSALGIDKAVLYGREGYIADELQRTMLPETLPRPTGVRLASRYLPAAETARVGGDWYDAIPLPGSRVALVVGDVMGHSMTSAAIMGQLRTTAQTLAGLDLPPQEVLHHLDEQAQRLGTDRMATCLYAVYDPVSHRITIANAGHPPPVLLHLGGRAEVLDIPSGAPIGVGGVDFEAVELDAPAGATLFLYTDGLVESRLRDVWTGIEQLREKLAATAQLTGPDHPPPLEALCDEVLDMLGPGDRDDDIALLAARFDGIAPSDVAYWHLDPEDAPPRQARRLVSQALSRWGLDGIADSVVLMANELVTNAVLYASHPFTLRLLRTDVLRCEVGDNNLQLPRLRQRHELDDKRGRGLVLVSQLARSWGSTRLSTGKVVWFEHSLQDESERPSSGR